MKSDNRDYLGLSDYSILIKEFRVFTEILIYSIYQKNNPIEVKFFIYTLSRNITKLESINILFEKKHYNDCISLYRGLIERLLLMYHLIDKDEIELFDNWSFIQNIEARNNVKSDPSLKDEINNEFYEESLNRRERYKKLKEIGITWKRPDLEKVAKGRNVLFLYKYGYDFASGYVHPLSSDG